ncbi:nucleoside-diphosphate-sugar epimerase [Rhodoligotrophos appendicifer]|uniref:NAD-dependent epimerase/dehydratase family protein n=1 Tax=Rhodoligotrophos appendicifer TaxID=987056 RepID=UPI00118540EC|nr:NAD-dependent epimerase/dehydratase family protein [Rhodoligotrophos appendicifer]
MRVLVTGGGGFLGAFVIKRLLARGADVRVLDTNADRALARSIAGEAVDGIGWIVGDVSDRTMVDGAVRGCTHIAHIAGVLTPVCRADPIRGAEINLMGTLYVFDAALRHGIQRVVYTSSAGVYSKSHGAYPDPATHYGAFKLAGEGSARAFWEDHGISSTGIRPLVIYGPGREGGPSAGISLACRAAAQNTPYVIPFAGRSGFVYVDEVAEVVEMGLDAEPGSRVYPMKGDVTTVEQIIEAIRKYKPDAQLSCHGDAIWLTTEFDDDLLYRENPDHKRVLIDEGLKKTLDFYATRP